MRNLDIFTLETPSHTTRRISLPGGGEAYPYSNLAVGRIDGNHRSIPALVSDGVTDGDDWYLVNLVDMTNGNSRYCQTVAVLGATSFEQARTWAIKNVGAYIGAGDAWECVTATAKVIKIYLGRPSSAGEPLPIRQNDMNTIAAQITDKPVIWCGAQLVSHEPSELLHELVKHDDGVRLMDAMMPDELPVLMLEMGGELAEYDALIVDYNRLDLLMQRLNAAMQKSSFGNVKPVNVTQSKPFKRNNVTNVAALFEMSDGQSVTIVFHSPDSTPAKLGPSDTLTSWKWMLNKRDISAAVAPANGENVKLPELAKRILLVVEKNSARFARANGNKAAQIQDLADTNNRISQKQEALAGILAENKALQERIDAGAVVSTAAAASVPTPTISGKKILVGPVEYIRKITIPKSMISGDEPTYYISNGQTSFEHFRISVADDGNGPYALVEYKENAGNAWLPLKTNAIESRYFKAVNAKAAEVFNDYMAKQGGLPIKAADEDAKQDISPVILTGKELGDFPDTPEGKKALRAAAKAEFEKHLGEWIPCPALGGDVELRKSGMKKVLSLSADTRKLKIIPMLRDVIGNAVKIESMKPDNQSSEPSTRAYHILRSEIMLDGEDTHIRLVVREDEKGQYHYDHAIVAGLADEAEKSPSFDGLDSVTTTNGGAGRTGATHIARHQLDSSLGLFDSTVNSGQMVINLFIEGEEPEVIEEDADSSDSQPVAEADKEAGQYFLANRHLIGTGTKTGFNVEQKVSANIDATLRGLASLQQEAELQIADLASGKLKAIKVVGSGYGTNTKAAAQEYLNQQLVRVKEALAAATGIQTVAENQDGSEKSPDPATNPDSDFLNAIIAGTPSDMQPKELTAKMRAIYQAAKDSGDADMLALGEQAIKAYAAQVKAKAQAKLGDA